MCYGTKTLTKDTKTPINTGEPQPAQLTERTLQQSNPFQREQLVQHPLESTQVHQPQSVSEVMQAAEQHEADLQRQAEEQRLREERQAEEAELRARAEHASAREHREDLEHGTELARNAFQTAIQKAETLLGRHDLPEEAKSLLDYLGQIIQSMRERLTGLEAGMTGWRHEVLTRIETARATMESQPELSDRARTADNIRAEYELLGRRSSMLEAVYQRHTQNLQLLMLPFEETKPEGFTLEKLMVFFRKAEISDMTEPMETSVSNFPEKLEDELVRAGTLTAILTTPGTGEELRDPRKTLPHLRETINGVTHGWFMSGKIKDLGSDFDIVKLPAFMLADEEESPAIMELFRRYQFCHGGNEYLRAGVRFQESYDTEYDEAMAAYHEARDTYRSLRDRYNAQQERLRLEEEERQRRFLERRAREQQGLPPLPEPEPTEEQVEEQEEEAYIDKSEVEEAMEASAKAATLASNMRRQKNILSDPTKKYLKDGNDMAQTLGSGMTLVFAKAQEEYDALTSEDEKKAYRQKSFEDLVRLSEQIGRVTGLYTRLVFPDRERTEEEERRLTPLYNRAMDRFKLRAAERMQELAHPETIQQSQEEGQKQSLVVIMQSTMQQIINDAEHTVQYMLSERDSEDASVAYERMTDVYHDLDWHEENDEEAEVNTARGRISVQASFLVDLETPEAMGARLGSAVVKSTGQIQEERAKREQRLQESRLRVQEKEEEQKRQRLQQEQQQLETNLQSQQQERDELQRQIDAQQAQQQVHTTHIHLVNQHAADQQVLVPKHALGQSSDFVDIHGNTVKGVGKCKTFCERHFGFSVSKLRERITHHVDRLFASTGDVSDAQLAETATRIASATGIFETVSTKLGKNGSLADETASESKFMKKCKEKHLADEQGHFVGNVLGDEQTARRLNLFMSLSKASDPGEIARICTEARGVMVGPEGRELKDDDPYYDQFRNAQKTIVLYRLVKGLRMPTREDGLKPLREELDTRVDAAKVNLCRLWEALIQSDDYSRARNRAASIQDLTGQRDQKNVEISATQQRLADIRSTIDQLPPLQTYTEEKQTATDHAQNLQESVDWSREMNLEEQIRKLQENQEFNYGWNFKKKELMFDTMVELQTQRARDRHRRVQKRKAVNPRGAARDHAFARGVFDQLVEFGIIRHRCFRQDTGLMGDIHAMYGSEAGPDFSALLQMPEVQKLITELAENQIAMDKPGGVESWKQLGDLTREQMLDYVEILRNRILPLAALYTPRTAQWFEDKTFTEKMFRQVLSGEDISMEELMTRMQAFHDETMNKTEILEDEEAILLLGDSWVSERISIDMFEGQKSATLTEEKVRWEARVNRMMDIDDTVEEYCRQGCLTRPQSYYAFGLTQTGWDQMTTKDRREAYKGYLEDWKKESIQSGNDRISKEITRQTRMQTELNDQLQALEASLATVKEQLAGQETRQTQLVDQGKRLQREYDERVSASKDARTLLQQKVQAFDMAKAAHEAGAVQVRNLETAVPNEKQTAKKRRESALAAARQEEERLRTALEAATAERENAERAAAEADAALEEKQRAMEQNHQDLETTKEEIATLTHEQLRQSSRIGDTRRSINRTQKRLDSLRGADPVKLAKDVSDALKDIDKMLAYGVYSHGARIMEAVDVRAEKLHQDVLTKKKKLTEEDRQVWGINDLENAAYNECLEKAVQHFYACQDVTVRILQDECRDINPAMRQKILKNSERMYVNFDTVDAYVVAFRRELDKIRGISGSEDEKERERARRRSERMMTDAARKDERLSFFRAPEHKDYLPFIPVLMRDKRFTEHVLTDTEAEFIAFRTHMINQLTPYAELLSGTGIYNGLIDQYLIGFGPAITAAVLDRNAAAVDYNTLKGDFEKYYTQIAEFKVKGTKKSIDGILRKAVSEVQKQRTAALTEQQKQSKTDLYWKGVPVLDDMTMYTMMLVRTGTQGLNNDTTIAKYRSFAAQNRETLHDVLTFFVEEHIPYPPKRYWETDEEYRFRKQDIDKERDNFLAGVASMELPMLMQEPEEYGSGLEERLTLYRSYQRVDYVYGAHLTAEQQYLKSMSEHIIQAKEKGRKLFRTMREANEEGIAKLERGVHPQAYEAGEKTLSEDTVYQFQAYVDPIMDELRVTNPLIRQVARECFLERRKEDRKQIADNWDEILRQTLVPAYDILVGGQQGEQDPLRMALFITTIMEGRVYTEEQLRDKLKELPAEREGEEDHLTDADLALKDDKTPFQWFRSLVNLGKHLPAHGGLNATYSDFMARSAYFVSLKRGPAIKGLQSLYTRMSNLLTLDAGITVFAREHMRTGDTPPATGEISFHETELPMFRQGTMELLAEYGLDTSRFHTVEEVTDALKVLFKAENGGLVRMKYMISDQGDYYGIGSEKTVQDRAAMPGQETRESFEQQLKKKLGRKSVAAREYFAMDPQARILVAQMVANDRRYVGVQDTAAQMLMASTVQGIGSRLQEVNKAGVHIRDMMADYISGIEEVAAPDYAIVSQRLFTRSGIHEEDFLTAIRIVQRMQMLRQAEIPMTVQEIEEMIQEQEQALREGAEQVAPGQETVADRARKAPTVLRSWARKLRFLNSDMTNDERAHRFFHMVRSFQPDAQAYLKEISGRADLSMEEQLTVTRLRNVLDLYNQMERYEGYLQLEQQLRAHQEQQMPGYYAGRVGMQEPTLEKLQQEKERWQESFRAGELRSFDFMVIQTQEQQAQRPMEMDEDEVNGFYPEAMVSAVNRVDCLIAIRGRTSGIGHLNEALAAQILNRPIRERLLIYYMIENGLTDNVPPLDISFSQLAYTPDLQKLEANLTGTRLAECVSSFSDDAASLQTQVNDVVSGRRQAREPGADGALVNRQQIWEQLVIQTKQLSALIEGTKAYQDKEAKVERLKRSVQQYNDSIANKQARWAIDKDHPIPGLGAANA